MDKIAEILKQLADKLGTTVEHLWGVLVSQAIISFWADMVFYTIAVVIIIVGAKIIIGCVRRAQALWMEEVDNYYWHDSGKEAKFNGNIAGGAVTVIIVFIFSIASLAGIEDTITKRYNPEYYALQQVTKLLK